MQIGILAKKIGLSADAIRFYERNALLPRPTRTQGGFRQYAESDLETLAFIRRVAGSRIQTQRDSGASEVARDSIAATCRRKALGCAAEARRSPQAAIK